MMLANMFKDRLIIQVKDTTQTALGETVIWKPVARNYGRVIPLSAEARAVYQQMNSVVTHKIVLNKGAFNFDHWVSPTSHNDPDSTWVNESNAYDDAIGTYSYSSANPNSWSKYLELILTTPLFVDKIRYYADYRAGEVTKISVDVYYNSAWHNIHEGAFADREWEEREITGGMQSVSKARIKLYNETDEAPSPLITFYEFAFFYKISVSLGNNRILHGKKVYELVEPPQIIGNTTVVVVKET